ncbi:MAG TPA: carboxypeptidase regulatory-like domain-containing protein, partial [Alphaproteobacteria bacterium]|nr:carboxypeptidase regulatory-like domain-containing protein [Alphaproteobacteria bacterium]
MGTVLTIEPITVPMHIGSSMLMQQLVVRFRVNKAYSGNPGSEVAVQTGLGGGDCGYHFDPGHTYLVYGYKSNGNLYTGICSGTQPIEQAGAALTWLDSLPSLPKDANIFGKVNQRTIKDNAPAPGITVSVSDPSGRERTTSTDASGAYSMTGLLPGDYVVSLSVPKGMTGNSTSRRIQLHEQGCAEASFWITTDG